MAKNNTTQPQELTDEELMLERLTNPDTAPTDEPTEETPHVEKGEEDIKKKPKTETPPAPTLKEEPPVITPQSPLVETVPQPPVEKPTNKKDDAKNTPEVVVLEQLFTRYGTFNNGRSIPRQLIPEAINGFKNIVTYVMQHPTRPVIQAAIRYFRNNEATLMHPSFVLQGVEQIAPKTRLTIECFYGSMLAAARKEDCNIEMIRSIMGEDYTQTISEFLTK